MRSCEIFFGDKKNQEVFAEKIRASGDGKSPFISLGGDLLPPDAEWIRVALEC